MITRRVPSKGFRVASLHLILLSQAPWRKDGKFFYQYDGFNRLVQVNEASGLVPAHFEDPEQNGRPGRLEDNAVTGPVLAKFVYDGFGRLIRTQRWSRELYGPWYDPETERYYYDGTRRIHERVVDQWGSPFVRDYIWGPGYIDELVCRVQTVGGAETLYYLQDANYNVVGVLDENANVLLQYTYTPYGELLAVDDRTGGNPPDTAVGHQGLFYERIYPTAGETVFDPPLAVGTTGLYHNRNRWLSPTLGRFLTRDPNESAMPIIVALASNGGTMEILFGSFSPQGHYGDGLNVYEYLGSNPVKWLDALGLNSDFENDIDDLIGELEGHKLYAIGAINEGARIAALGLRTSLIIASSILGLDVFESVYLLASGKGGFWAAMDIVLSANPLGRVTKLIGKGLKWVRRAGKVVGAFADWLEKGSRNVSVYIGYRNGRAVYVGISGNVARRAAQHGKRFDYLDEVGSGLTRNEARSVEQVIIERNAGFENKINSISATGEFYDQAIEWGSDWLGQRGLTGYY